ncbi:unnamed protein product [Camellia sinensis]
MYFSAYHFVKSQKVHLFKSSQTIPPEEMAKVDFEGWFNGGGDEEGYDAVVVGFGYGCSVAAFQISMAGIKVCLMEKGRRWQAHDFPTDVLKFMSAVRMENTNLGFTFGPKDALFQVSIQDDSVATVACGLGGGSLVYARVMMPAPIRARRNPKWPKEWEKDWEMCEASASSMLRIQSVPIMYPNAKIMKGIVEEDGFKETSSYPLKLSVNFDIEEQPSDSSKFQLLSMWKLSCWLAFGNLGLLAGYGTKPIGPGLGRDSAGIYTSMRLTMLHLILWSVWHD